MTANAEALATVRKLARERRAMDLAEAWVAADLAYGTGSFRRLTARERMLMQLALRAYTHPEATESGLRNLEAHL